MSTQGDTTFSRIVEMGYPTTSKVTDCIELMRLWDEVIAKVSSVKINRSNSANVGQINSKKEKIRTDLTTHIPSIFFVPERGDPQCDQSGVVRQRTAK